MGLVRNGVLLATGETLADVQNRVLGTAASAPLYTTQPGFVVFGLRGFPPHSAFDVAVLAENLGDVNYRIYGSGLDAPGANVRSARVTGSDDEHAIVGGGDLPARALPWRRRFRARRSGRLVLLAGGARWGLAADAVSLHRGLR